jgi:hypothetical protein
MEAASFSEERRKDTADDPTPIFHRGHAKKKKPITQCVTGFSMSNLCKAYFLSALSSDTVSFFLPFALRAASTLRPFAEAILLRNPCLLLLFLLDG